MGSWSETKHDHLNRYIEATREVRRKFLPPAGGGACFIDLFAGPGRVRLRNSLATTIGSPLIALAHELAPFTRVVLCETDRENLSSLRARTSADAHRVTIVEGDCNTEIDRVVQAIPRFGFNIAFIDPFGAKTFRWSTIQKLGAFKRMDLLLHFPTNTVKRNFLRFQKHEVIDQMLGTNSWRQYVNAADEVPRLVERTLREQLATLGYRGDSVRDISVKNETNGLLYHLVFASKDDRGTAIWKSITRRDAHQGRLNL